jgi:hypothetical protein
MEAKEIPMEANIQQQLVMDPNQEREEMEIFFSSLSYTVKMKSTTTWTWKGRKKKKNEKKILNDLNGVFHCGELIAVMGCSGTIRLLSFCSFCRRWKEFVCGFDRRR